MFRVFAAFTAIALLAQICVASAGDYGTRDEAVAMVKRVEDMFAKAGPDSTFKAVSDKSLATFHDRDLYPFIYDLSGRCVAHGARPALIGKNLLDLKDQDGKYLIREMIRIASGTGFGGSITSGQTRSTKSRTRPSTSKRWVIISSASECTGSNAALG